MENKVKKFSTLGWFSGLCPLLLCSLISAPAISLPIVNATDSASGNFNAKATPCSFLANAPDQHVVVQGDTLWGISRLFAEHPWCWPSIWGMNRQEIKNPHWIYPGQTIYFDRVAKRLRLGKPLDQADAETVPSIRLSPKIRSEPLPSNAITTIPANAIGPFLSQPILFEKDELANAPHIVLANRSHINSVKSEKTYVKGDLRDLTDFQVYRPATPLIDPETKELLGYEYTYVGSVKLTKKAAAAKEAHTFLVTNAKEELSVGDRLLSVPLTEITNYVPHSPNNKLNGRVVSVYGGVALAGQNQTIAVNLGSKDGIDVGTVLKMYRTGKTVVDKLDNNGLVQIPNEEYGTLFIYRVFNKASYGLIMGIADATRVGDTVKSPE
ncbi:MAG: LysM peptidoglycan-binding protein [Solimicrobium sp.]|jgi:hypothetical protein|nr:LysM peptidoglycan-binding protein [Solimicrobium sp.]